MDIKEMKKQIEEKCFTTECEKCPLFSHKCYEESNAIIIKENYELMFPKKNIMEDTYIIIDGEKFKISIEDMKILKL